MDLKETIASNLDKIKTAMDADGDGKVTAAEALGAFGGRIDSTASGAAEFASEVKDAFDLNGDGKVTPDEVAEVAKSAFSKVGEAVEGTADTLKGAVNDFLKKDEEIVEAQVIAIEDAEDTLEEPETFE